MFIGEYAHSIDAKKRLAVPAKLRKELGERAVITRGLDACLVIYPFAAWEKLVQKLAELPQGKGDTRSFTRLMLSGAQEVELDALGRVLIPDYLKEYANLHKRVTIAGVFDRLEIWDADRWQQYKKTAERATDATAEKLGELGVY
ncbi:MAG: division/cell wall cluster transcriptional repressor MraZ [bacterium]|nr:division/cell wall cluster transcriptional repressor MraZ [bacterium]